MWLGLPKFGLVQFRGPVGRTLNWTRTEPSVEVRTLSLNPRTGPGRFGSGSGRS